MANLSRNFTAGRMNKIMDQRVLPDGEYINAMNIRMGSTENSEYGVIENTKGNLALTSLTYIDGTPLSVDAVCIGAVTDSANELIYWFVHDPSFISSPSGKLDMIVSFNVFTNILTYHVISINDNYSGNTTLNFNPKYLITGVDIIENLMFFTDDYNPPRFIDVTKNYPNPIGVVDQFSSESILVIKKPPMHSPSIEPFVTNGQENYLETRFICFAYRYQYSNGEYSATSQWSQPAFVPKQFDLSTNSYLNEGMVNFCNACNITYNTGGPLVVGIDLLFKQSENNVIKVIEKLDKQELGLSDNTDYQYVFSNSKIFTVLSESEILRLYDNVPRFAKAQTIMGNRLMYGNYVEGYDLVDKNQHPVRFTYTTELTSDTIGETSLIDSTSLGNYSIDGFRAVPNSIVEVDLTGMNLTSGALFTLDVRLEHSSFSGTIVPTETSTNVNASFSFFLPQNYASVFDMASSVQFQDAIGTSLPSGNIQPVFPPTGQSCLGITFTDTVNCQIPNNLTTSVSPFSVTKVGSGISALEQGISVITTPGSNIIKLQFNAMKFVDNTTTPTVYCFEYYSVSFAEATFQDIAVPSSLHSNRDYEIGIVYMDDFLRSSTALVSQNNTIHIPCGYADTKNGIRVTIPTSQIAPEWATSYKFVIKPDKEKYETVYSSLFFLNKDTNEAYFLLEGENPRKVLQGDRLIVKSDSNGPTQSCVYATVLEKEAKSVGFIQTPTGATPPAGTYMKINPNDFSVVEDPNANIHPGTYTVDAFGGDHPIMRYPMNIEDPSAPGTYIDYTIPSGSRIKISVTTQRLGPGKGDRICEKRVYILDKILVSSADYDSIQDWWNGDNVGAIVNDGVSDVGGGNCPVDNEYISTTATSPTDIPYNVCKNYWKFYRNLSNNKLELLISATQSCTGAHTKNRKSTIIANIEVYRVENTFIFETEPVDALPDVFYENELSFAIDSNGQHMGNVQNQDFGSGAPAIIDTNFFNCYAFGNGAESYKIRDSIVGKPFSLGNRVTTVSSQDYRMADRFADITYSGIYNTESNLNKLNEFNIGLLNYKYLEVSFGEIFKLDGRETDVLVLQEDKISYVLAGKNLLSDSAAGGAITSVPEVLGTQIARTEKYGISFNPESYVQWGYDRYFTDAKRGAVIQLQGNSYSNEQIKIISEPNMRTWFRDVFNASFATQKLGGFDPYMNEYVLVMSDRELPINPKCLDCGVSQVFTLSTADADPKTQTYCVNLGAIVGQSEVIYNVISVSSAGGANIAINYNGNDFETGYFNTSGTYSFTKDSVSEDTANITITYLGDIVLDVTINCPDAIEMKIVRIVLTNNADSGDTIHAEYSYTSGTYASPIQSNLISFISGTTNPLVSSYTMVTGYEGNPGFAPSGSTMTIQSNKILFDTFNFDSSYNKFKYYRSDTLYANNSVDIGNLLSVATTASPILGGGTLYYSDFTVPLSGEYLYLIWDLRKSSVAQLCYHEFDISQVCCYCSDCNEGDCVLLDITCLTDITGTPTVYFPIGICGRTEPYYIYMKPGDNQRICVNKQTYEITGGTFLIENLACNCTGCDETCSTFIIDNIVGASVWIDYIDCITKTKVIKQFTHNTEICCPIGTAPILYDGFCDITPKFECGCCNDSTCYTWTVKNIGSVPARVTYFTCEGGSNTNTVPVPVDGTIQFCGYPVSPTIDFGDVEITFECICFE